MSDTPTITVDFNQNAIRRGAIPTPDGALPSKRRNRRGMVNLAAWDAKVAADNQARGTASTSESPSLVELIQANVTPVNATPADEPDQAIAPPEAPQGIAPAPKPGEPDLPPSPATPQPPKTSLGAILEEQDGGKPQTRVELPPPDPAAVEAAKAALAAEAAAPAVDDPTIPPPPASKAASAKKPKPAK